MLIGLISDTHFESEEQKLPNKLYDAFHDVDLVLHAGDIWIPSVLDDLEIIAPVKAAKGDDDLEEDIGGDNRVAEIHIMSIEDLKIWLVHIKPLYNTYFGNVSAYSIEPVVKSHPDIVIYGHTHSASIENYNGIFLINPGSPTCPGHMPKLGTVGLLRLESGKFEASIVQL